MVDEKEIQNFKNSISEKDQKIKELESKTDFNPMIDVDDIDDQ